MSRQPLASIAQTYNKTTSITNKTRIMSRFLRNSRDGSSGIITHVWCSKSLTRRSTRAGVELRRATLSGARLIAVMVWEEMQTVFAPSPSQTNHLERWIEPNPRHFRSWQDVSKTRGSQEGDHPPHRMCARRQKAALKSVSAGLINEPVINYLS